MIVFLIETSQSSFFRPLRESLADVRGEESWEEEDAGLQVQPQPHFQPGCDLVRKHA